MSMIEGYGVYQNRVYDRSTQNGKARNAKGTDTTEKTGKGNQVKLSDKALRLLDELKRLYGNMDFIIADYETDEEAAAYLSRGTKEYSVLIDPETLEEMAADDDVKEKYLGIIDESTGKLNEMKDQLGDRKSEIAYLGISIGKDGAVSYFAGLEQLSEKQRERIEKAKEDGKEESPVHARTKKTRVEADSVEELLEQIRNVDWSKIQDEARQKKGGRFDFSI